MYLGKFVKERACYALKFFFFLILRLHYMAQIIKQRGKPMTSVAPEKGLYPYNGYTNNNGHLSGEKHSVTMSCQSTHRKIHLTHSISMIIAKLISKVGENNIPSICP